MVMNQQEVALYVYRKLVYLLYLEVGALQHRVHPDLAKKAKLNTAYFQREKDRQALALYREIENETDVYQIEAPFKERTGLTMNDVHRAFVEGDWSNKFGGFNFGGPRWKQIADAAVELRDQILQENWEGTADVIQRIKAMKTNQGYLINQFDRTDRRR